MIAHDTIEHNEFDTTIFDRFPDVGGELVGALGERLNRFDFEVAGVSKVLDYHSQIGRPIQVIRPKFIEGVYNPPVSAVHSRLQELRASYDLPDAGRT